MKDRVTRSRKGKAAITCLLAVMLLIALTACGNQQRENQGDKDTTPTPTAIGGANPTAAEPTTETGSTKSTPTPFVTPAPAAHAEQEIKFSIEDNFLSETTELQLSAGAGDTIYYTTNGDIPDETSTLYTDKITLRATSAVRAFPISARALHADGSWSENCVRTYFTGTSIDSRYDCLVFSITTEPYNLFDYEYGIFVGGKILDDYLRSNPTATVDGSTPANYHMRGRESERPIYVEILNSDGSLILEQNAGIRTYGGWSRASAMTPMKLFARKEYDEVNNKFRYPFFTTSLDENGEVIDAFKRLVLRSYGNDNGFGFIREEIFQVLAKQAGYEAKSVRPCAVYVNGEYYGAYFLTEVYHDSYFETHYGKYDGTVDILEGGELFKTGESDGSNQYAVDDYNAMYETYAYSDLTDDTLYNELCELVDVQNYLEYYAYEIYLGNKDWPHNNYKVYRYYAAEGEEYSDEAPFDGKWRYLLHDLDFSTGIYGESALSRYIADFLGKVDGVKEEECPLFGQLMRRADCKEIFIRKSLDLINGVFATDYFSRELDALNELRLNEQEYSYQSGKIADWVQFNQLEGRMDDLKEFITYRDNYVYMNLYAFFRLKGEKYTLKLDVPEGSQVSINSFTTDENFEGRYYSDFNTTLKANINNGQSFAYWMVDGQQYMEEELVITPELLNGSYIIVEPVFE